MIYEVFKNNKKYPTDKKTCENDATEEEKNQMITNNENVDISLPHPLLFTIMFAFKCLFCSR